MADISELLDRLKVADPGTYETAQLYTREVAECDARYQDIVQGCIQRAIAVRGWVFDIEGKIGFDSYPPSAGYVASISELGAGYDGDYYNPRHQYCICESRGDTPSEAILASYLAALEAQ